MAWAVRSVTHACAWASVSPLTPFSPAILGNFALAHRHASGHAPADSRVRAFDEAQKLDDLLLCGVGPSGDTR